MRKTIIALLTLAVAVSAISCIYDFDINVPAGERDVIVFEGNIRAGAMTEIKVSRCVALDDSTTIWDAGSAVYNALTKIWIECEDGTVIEGQRGSGIYLFDTRDLDKSKKYRVAGIRYTYPNNMTPEMYLQSLGSPALFPDLPTKHEYYSEWVDVLKVAPIDSLSFEIKNKDKISFRVSVGEGGGSDYFLWTGRETWEYTAQYYASCYYYHYTNSIKQFENGQNVYYCWSECELPFMVTASSVETDGKLVNQELYTYGNRESKLRYIYSVEIIQENVTEESYRYYSTMNRNSTDVGGLFSPQPSDLRGNIVNALDSTEQVIGFITASEVTSTRLFYNNNYERFCKVGFGETPEVQVFSKKDWPNAYRKGLYPYMIHIEEDGFSAPDENVYDWLPARCLDCTLSGGHKNKPDYWPNDHI